MDPDMDPGFWWPKVQGRKTDGIFLYPFLSKIAMYLSLSLHKGRPSYRRSPQKRTFIMLKKLNLLTFLWVIFALLDPDTDPQHCHRAWKTATNPCWAVAWWWVHWRRGGGGGRSARSVASSPGSALSGTSRNWGTAGAAPPPPPRRVGKNPGLKKKPAQWVFWFIYIYICPE